MAARLVMFVGAGLMLAGTAFRGPDQAAPKAAAASMVVYKSAT